VGNEELRACLECVSRHIEGKNFYIPIDLAESAWLSRAIVPVNFTKRSLNVDDDLSEGCSIRCDPVENVLLEF
jgi:hypothetical protein